MHPPLAQIVDDAVGGLAASNCATTAHAHAAGTLTRKLVGSVAKAGQVGRRPGSAAATGVGEDFPPPRPRSADCERRVRGGGPQQGFSGASPPPPPGEAGRPGRLSECTQFGDGCRSGHRAEAEREEERRGPPGSFTLRDRSAIHRRGAAVKREGGGGRSSGRALAKNKCSGHIAGSIHLGGINMSHWQGEGCGGGGAMRSPVTPVAK